MRDPVRALAARTLVLGIPGTTLDDTTRALLSEGPGGVILFRRNLRDAEQVIRLIASIRHAAPSPLWISIDQEGGRVARLRGIASDLPPMGHLDGPEAAAAAGRLLARELLALGFDLDFAPVVDVLTNPDNPVIGDRAFGATPEVVIERALPFLEALQAGGVAACAKHFPGHGDTRLDSHRDLPRVEHDRQRLEAVELPPFAAAIRAGVATIMTAHVVLETIDPERPATLSPPVLSILRRDLGFDGLCPSDDLEMGAIARRLPIPEAAVQALAAGVDQVLICHSAGEQRAALDALVDAVRTGRLSRARLEEAAARVEAALVRFPPDRPRPPFEGPRPFGPVAIPGPPGTDPTGDR
ncbi:MAG: beta-N-acetylhexosaminidase [Deltaproteobacteria bacterium]|nr:MAG: beta-N-acetylhexosaminidase [Deltaproteobacteria bacterium]